MSANPLNWFGKKPKKGETAVELTKVLEADREVMKKAVDQRLELLARAEIIAITGRK